ncbi:MAG: efflux RND transporter permease subunit, partial [Oscillospiraceae bacterium]
IVLMYFSGVTLNIISLSGLALGVGMLVDNSIVVIENTYRLRNLGYSMVDAAVQGAQQVGGAILASTLTTVCVFLPIVFTQGISRQIFTDMGLTIGYSLVASLIVAMTFVPALSSNILTSETEKKSKLFDRFVDWYERALRYNLKHKWIVIGLTTALLAVVAYKTLTMPMAFIPPMDSPQMQMTLSLPKETSRQELIDASQEVAKIVGEIEDVETVAVMDGGNMMSAGSSKTKDMSFYVVLKEDKTLDNNGVANLIREKTPQYKDQLTVTTDSMNMSALGGSGISIAIKGNDLDQLQRISTDMSQVLMKVEGIKSTKDGSEDTIQEVRIDIDKQKAMEHGLTTAQVYQKVSEALKESTDATTLTFDGEDLKAKISHTKKESKETLPLLEIAREEDKDGKETVTALGDIARVYTAKSPKAINRDNQSRTMTLSAEIQEGYNVSLVAREVEKALKGYEVPKGYSYEMVGENQTIKDAMSDLVTMIALAIVFIYLIMVAQFQSLLSPFIVLFTIPLAFTGGLLALQLTGTVLSVVSMIGFLILAGVVVNNGIVFVDYVNQLRLEGMDKNEALVKTGRDRIRPILMTALTTILAMSTMALGVGMGADMSQGMAVVTIGGLSYATLLTLFLVPALYDILHKKPMKKIEVSFEE